MNLSVSPHGLRQITPSSSQERLVLMVTILVTCLAAHLGAQASAASSGLINSSDIVYARGTGKVYAVDTANGSVSIILPAGGVKVVKTGSGPISVAVNNRTRMAYVANAGSESVSVIDGVADKVIATVPTAARPYAIAVDELTDRVYVSNTFSNKLNVIDGKTNLASNIQAGSADAILVDSEEARVYLLGY